MALSISYDEIVKQWYDKAMKIAEMTISKQEKETGRFHKALDIELVKISGVAKALEKVYNKYDPENEKGASLDTFLSTVVHNTVLTELKKEGKKVEEGHGFKKPKEHKYKARYGGYVTGGIGSAKPSVPSSYSYSSEWAEQKEKVLSKLMKCVDKLPPVDQKVVVYWMKDKRTYITRVLNDLGMEDNKRNRDTVSLWRNRAFVVLKKLMGGKKPDYRDIYVSDPLYESVSKGYKGSVDYSSVSNKMYRKMLDAME